MADKLVESKIRCDKVTLFTERGCRYCRNAEEMLKQYNFVPGALEVVDTTQRKDVQDYLQQRTGHRTQPALLINLWHCFVLSCLLSSLGDAASEDYPTCRTWTASSPEYCSRSVPCSSVRERDDQELHLPHSDIQQLPEGNSWKLPSAGSGASSRPMQLLSLSVICGLR
ncbi:glutaredoxin-1 isoform X1 [Pezoporus occidentalis]|uniref:glutaredoxin-1 isoform X1 n=1 Tax=Pezoporus occidentalis TaxID=407982 RepID=UPI002F90820B